MDKSELLKAMKTIIDKRVISQIIKKWKPRKICNAIGLRWQYFPEMHISNIELEDTWNINRGRILQVTLKTKYLKGYFYSDECYDLQLYLDISEKEMVVLTKVSDNWQHYKIFGKEDSSELIKLINQYRDIK